MLHVDKDKTHVDVITLMLHVDINYLVRRGQKCATIIFKKAPCYCPCRCTGIIPRGAVTTKTALG